MPDSHNKHFLDSSVVRPLLLGSAPYRQYFKKYFNEDRLYTSNFVQMEFLRSFILPILNFYFVLDMPNVRTISDALSIWSNRFKTSEQKAVIQLLGLLFKTRLYDSSSYRDKNKALRAISQIVIRYYAKLKRGFHNIGERGTRCERAKIFIKRKRGVSDKIIFQGFLDKFLDLKECRYKCGIERFLCGRYKSEVEKYIEYASNLANPLRRENKGFIEISKKLNRILQKEIINSCKLCEAIGDAVIALETPENMILEHTDHSFNLLCELIEKPHYQHPSEISVVKN